MPRPTRWKGCVNGLKERVRACFICPPIRLTSIPSKWLGPKLSSSCAKPKRALWRHFMRRSLRPYKLSLQQMPKASSSMSDFLYDPCGNRYNKWTAVVDKQKPVDIIPDNASSMYESAPKPASGIGHARETSDVMMRTMP